MKRSVLLVLTALLVLPLAAAADPGPAFSTADGAPIEWNWGVCGVYNTYTPCMNCCASDGAMDQLIQGVSALACKFSTELILKVPACSMVLATGNSEELCGEWNCAGKQGTPCSLKPGWMCGDCGVPPNGSGKFDLTCGLGIACCPPEFCEEEPAHPDCAKP